MGKYYPNQVVLDGERRGSWHGGRSIKRTERVRLEQSHGVKYRDGRSGAGRATSLPTASGRARHDE
jgi:hypothetical protein